MTHPNLNPSHNKSPPLCLIHTNVRVRENGCMYEKDKYLNNLFNYNFDRYVKYVILVNDYHLKILNFV